MCSRKAFYQHRGYHPTYHCKGRGRHGHHTPWKKHRHRWGGWGNWNYPPVNVEELDDRYELLLYAPGLKKEDFRVMVKDDLLVIKAKAQESDIVEELNWKRREFKASGFQRAFELNEKVDKEKISAAYQEGVLKVTLPKLPGFESTSYDISVD